MTVPEVLEYRVRTRRRRLRSAAGPLKPQFPSFSPHVVLCASESRGRLGRHEAVRARGRSSVRSRRRRRTSDEPRGSDHTRRRVVGPAKALAVPALAIQFPAHFHTGAAVAIIERPKDRVPQHAVRLLDLEERRMARGRVASGVRGCAIVSSATLLLVRVVQPGQGAKSVLDIGLRRAGALCQIEHVVEIASGGRCCPCRASIWRARCSALAIAAQPGVGVVRRGAAAAVRNAVLAVRSRRRLRRSSHVGSRFLRCLYIR